MDSSNFFFFRNDVRLSITLISIFSLSHRDGSVKYWSGVDFMNTCQMPVEPRENSKTTYLVHGWQSGNGKFTSKYPQSNHVSMTASN